MQNKLCTGCDVVLHIRACNSSSIQAIAVCTDDLHSIRQDCSGVICDIRGFILKTNSCAVGREQKANTTAHGHAWLRTLMATADGQT